MGIEVNWLEEQRIACVVVSGILDMKDVDAADQKAVSIMNQATLPLHLIIDLRDLEQFPPIIDVIRLRYIGHPRRGWIVIIGLTERPMFRVLVNSVVNGLRLLSRTAESLDEALDILQKLDDTL